MKTIRSICLLGFGEVGLVLAEELGGGAHCRLRAFDIRFDDEGSSASRNAARMPAVEAMTNAARAAAECDLIVSAVTASETVAAALSVTGGIRSGTWYLDLNSASPGSKSEVAGIIERAGGRFVEAAIMSPVEPERLASPILLGGPHAQSFLEPAAHLGFSGLTVYADRVGPASAAKMCRSVVIKGMESLLLESLIAARHYGVEEDVLALLQNLLPHPDWAGRARYMIGRSITHGVRRSAEMREAAGTVADAGLAPHMSDGCVRQQAEAVRFQAALAEESLPGLLDAILSGDGKERSVLEGGKP